MYAVIEACDGHIIRIEESIYDNGMIPYETTPYEVATGSAYGTGIPELAWPLQITLNNTLNRICENEEHNNNGMFFLGQGSRNALTSMTFEKHKLIPVTTTKDIQQIQIGNMVEAYAHVRDLREQIQKKTIASINQMIMQDDLFNELFYKTHDDKIHINTETIFLKE